LETFEYYRGNTLRNFKVFMDCLKSKEPVGSDSMRGSCGSFCSSINDLLEYLYNDKKEVIDKRYSVNTKNKFIEVLSSKTFDFKTHKVDGSLVKLTLDVGNAHKHKVITHRKPLIRDIAQVKESLILISYEDSEGVYYAIEKGVIVEFENKTSINLEVYSILCFEVVIELLIEFNIIDAVPSLSKEYRSFAYTREEAGSTFQRDTDICALPQYGKGESPPMYVQVFDISYPMNIRDRRDSDKINFSISVPVKVFENPMLTKPRK
jgi:hypothetical protein